MMMLLVLKWSFMFIATCLCQKGFGADQVFTCPDEFKDDAVNTLTVQINKTAMDNAECALTPRNVIFKRRRTTDDPSSDTTLCLTEYKCSTTAPVGDPTREKAECGCMSRSQDDILTFKLKLYANKTSDSGANYFYQVCINPKHTMTKDVRGSCDSASFHSEKTTEGPFMSVSTERTGLVLKQNQTTTLGQSPAPGSGCDTGCIVGIVCGVVAVVIIVIVIICIVQRKKWDGKIPVPT